MEAFFDALARGLATSVTRRQAVQIALGTMAGLMFPLPAAADSCCGPGLACCGPCANNICESGFCNRPSDTCCHSGGFYWGCPAAQGGQCCAAGGCCSWVTDCCPESGNAYYCCDTLTNSFCTSQPAQCCALQHICVAKGGEGAEICCDVYPQICARECFSSSSQSGFVSTGANSFSPQLAFAVVYNFAGFPTDGQSPNASLIQGPDGTLYGTTVYGGADDQGSIFAMAADGTVTILHSFTGSDGQNPNASLIQGPDGTLYGTTEGGGASFDGTVFRMAPDGNDFAVLYNFSGTDGAKPSAALIIGSDGNLYGTTSEGGAANLGTIFRVATDGSGFVLLRSFASGKTDGAMPNASLVQGADGMLYGTTTGGGGPSNFGTVFKMALDGSGFKVIHRFTGSTKDGGYPYAGVIQGLDQMLYGTTRKGGSKKLGTAFRIATDGTGFAVLHSFAGNKSKEGSHPYAGLIQGPDGTLYGTTATGGTSRVVGTIFQMAPDGSGYTILHIFDVSSSDGAVPVGGLLRAADGTIYGTTSLGGADGYGIIFQLS